MNLLCMLYAFVRCRRLLLGGCSRQRRELADVAGKIVPIRRDQESLLILAGDDHAATCLVAQTRGTLSSTVSDTSSTQREVTATSTRFETRWRRAPVTLLVHSTCSQIDVNYRLLIRSWNVITSIRSSVHTRLRMQGLSIVLFSPIISRTYFQGPDVSQDQDDQPSFDHDNLLCPKDSRRLQQQSRCSQI
jgi:hypothetical protein